LKHCPECGVEYNGERRHKYAEIMAVELDILLQERELLK